MDRLTPSKMFEMKFFLILFQLFLLLIFTDATSAATASISISGSEGPFTVTAGGSFPEYETCNSQSPPVCTTCNSGSIRLYLDGAPKGTAYGNGSATLSRDFDAGGMTQGNHTFSVIATDCKNNTGQAQDTITVDNTPELNIDPLETIDGLLDIKGTVDFKRIGLGAQGETNDGYIQLYLDGARRGNAKWYEDASSWSYEETIGSKLDAGYLSNGEHTLTVYAYAHNYAYTVQTIKFTVDNTPELTIDSPGTIDGLLDVKGMVDFKRVGLGAEGEANDGYIQLYLDGARRGNAKWYEDASSWSYEEIIGSKLDAGYLSNGEHTLTVYAYAHNYAYTVQTIKFTVDNIPELTIDSLGTIDGLLDVKGMVDFKRYGLGAEGEANDGYIQLYLDGARKGSAKWYEDASFWSYEEILGAKLDAGALSNGEHTLLVRAYAHNGVYVDKTLKFTVDNTPALTINPIDKPQGLFNITGTVDFKRYGPGLSGEANDGYIYLYFDGYPRGNKWYEDATSWSYEQIVGSNLNADTMAKGKHTITAVATAHNGAAKTVTRDFYIGDCSIQLEAYPTSAITPEDVLRVTAITQSPVTELEWKVTPGKGVTLNSSDVKISGNRISITNAQGEGAIDITVTNKTYPDCNKTIQVQVGCSKACGQNCSRIDLDSIKADIGIGNMDNGRSSGSLTLYSDLPSPDLAKPKSLLLSAPGSDTRAIYENKAVRQILAPQFFIDIVTETPYRYGIHFYPPEAAGNLVNGLYELSPGSELLYSWTIENPDASDTLFSRLKITEDRDGRQKVYDYQYDPDQKLWTLTKGDGLQTIMVKETATAEGREKLRTVKDSSGTIALQEKTVYKTINTGSGQEEVIIEEISDPDGAALSTKTTWYEAPCESGTCGRIKSRLYPDGSWVRYEYDSLGRKSIETRSRLDADPDAAPETVEATLYDYTPQSSDSRNALDERLPRKITRSSVGITTGVSYHVYTWDAENNLTTITEQGLTPDAAFGNPANIRRQKTVCAWGSGKASSGRIKFLTFEDGRIDNYTYEFGTYAPAAGGPGTFTAGTGAFVKETLTHGTLAHPAGIADKTTQEIRIFDPAGHALLEQTLVYTGTGYEPLTWIIRSFDKEGNLTQEQSSDGKMIEALWDCCGKSWEKDASGIEHTYTHDALGRVVTDTKHNGAQNPVTSYAYDAVGRVLDTRVEAGGLSKTLSKAYDTAGRLIQTIDEAGLLTLHAYTDSGRTITTTLPGGATEIQSHFRGGRIKSITGTGIVNQFYDYGINSDSSQWVSITKGSAQSPAIEKTTLDMAGRIIAQEKPGFTGTEITRTHYNAKNQVIRIETPGLADTLYEYNELGEAVKTGLDVNHTGSLEPASMDRIVTIDTQYVKTGMEYWHQTKKGLFSKDNTAYQKALSIEEKKLTGLGAGTIEESKTTDIAGNVTIKKTLLDRNTGTVTTTTTYPDSSVSEETVTQRGLVTSYRDKTGLILTYGYDPLERRISVTDPRTGTTTLSYNGQGRVAYTEDPAGNRTSYTYDPDTGRKTSETDALNQAIYFKYSNRGELTNTWGAVSPVQYEYDTFGRKVAMQTYRTGDAFNGSTWPDNPPSPDTTTWHYDEAIGLLLSKEDASGQSTAYTYSDAGRVKTRTSARTISGSPIITTYAYDPGTGDLTGIDYNDTTPDITLTRDRSGNLVTVTDAAGTRTFTYTDALQEASETLTGLISQTLTRQYETQGVAGRYTGFTIGSNKTVSYGYAPDGLMNAVSWSIAGQNDQVAYDYKLNAHLIESLAYGSGLKTAYIHDPARDLVTRVTNSYNTAPISDYAYTHDDLGRRISMTTEGAVFDANLPAGSELAKSGTTVYSPNALNQYAQIRKDGVAVTPLHDPDGNLMDDGKFAYTWDAENRLASVVPKSPAEKDKKLDFAYDYMGRRILKKVYEYGSGAWTHTHDLYFIYDGWNLISQIKQAQGQSPEETAFVWGLDLSGTLQEAGGIGGLLAKVDVTANKTYGFFYDANGNIGQMPATADGSVKASYEYSPFGSVIKASGDMAGSLEFRFSTKYFDTETGLYYYGYRYYDPDTGRWLSRDPLEEQGGINLYGFLGNDPVNWVDPLGLYRSYEFLRALVPGQVLFDQGLTAFENNQYIWGTAYIAGMLAEQVLFVLSFGEPAMINNGGQCLVSEASKTTALQKYYPDNNGFLGQSQRQFLEKGQMIDRYGGSGSSRFFSPAGTPTGARSLPAGSAGQPLRTFEVVKPFEVNSGTVAPAFGQPGLGTQFQSPVPLETLLKRGIISEVP